METTPDLRLVALSRMNAVGESLLRLESFLSERQVDPEVVFSAVLVLEEVLTNIIKYSYGEESEQEILVEVSFGARELSLRFTDQGREFDWQKAPGPDLSLPIEDRPIGGLGIHIVRNLARRMDYQRLEGKNVLELFLPLQPKP